jgi:hypothetical protein|nr:hypothetical protein [Streptomyces coelicolor]
MPPPYETPHEARSLPAPVRHRVDVRRSLMTYAVVPAAADAAMEA